MYLVVTRLNEFHQYHSTAAAGVQSVEIVSESQLK